MSKLLSYLRFSATLLCLLLLAACQTMGGPGLIQSAVTAELSPNAASSIAADMVERLAARRSRRPCGTRAMPS